MCSPRYAVHDYDDLIMENEMLLQMDNRNRASGVSDKKNHKPNAKTQQTQRYDLVC
jgi:hypothetical protein